MAGVRAAGRTLAGDLPSFGDPPSGAHPPSAGDRPSGAGRPAAAKLAPAAAKLAPAHRRGLADALLDRCEFPPAATTAPVPLAVSGGADSLALLVLAVRAGIDVVAIHVDHGLRAGSAREAEVVAAAAAAYGAAFESRSVMVPSGSDLEARARRARYGVLPSGVLTGHTMDDQAETVLLAMLRGAALDGLAGMRSTPAKGLGTGEPGGPDRVVATDANGPPRRPLLQLRRSETAALCAAEGLEPVDDPSNRDLRFRRNRVRHEVLPLLSHVAGRDLVPVLARQARLLGDDADLLEALSADIDPTDARRLAASPPPLARRAVRRWLRSSAGLPDGERHPPTADEVARVLLVARGDSQACQLAGGRRVERHAQQLRVTGQ